MGIKIRKFVILNTKQAAFCLEPVLLLSFVLMSVGYGMHGQLLVEQRDLLQEEVYWTQRQRALQYIRHNELAIKKGGFEKAGYEISFNDKKGVYQVKSPTWFYFSI
ncbi:hypothetical protein JOC36_001348 [Weissella uvarum]|uniref:hypothetical protein n=1 Tax=Weissella uvarum TaxID=1479233 RepID=UPI0019609D8E|nr:hypothetical protein [Weissella uvarum]MBM7617771.1 hypothetical protein [Weissella uvarum]MCM0595850.1 hypothetical protein [Weissella uvarum]